MEKPLNDSAELQEPGSPLVWLLVAGLVYCLLLGIALTGDGFVLISGGREGARHIFSFATNPLIGVLLGTLATALLQSSSAVTSIIVALVAGGLPVELAVPLVMGANMGTTVTNTIVSMGAARESGSFQRAFSAATVHDMFNLLAILIFLPIEILFSPLQSGAGTLAEVLRGSEFSPSGFNPLKMIVEPAAAMASMPLGGLPPLLSGSLILALGILAIVLSVLLLAGRLKSVLTGRAGKVVDAALGRGPVVSVSAGVVVTVAVQSSSTTTSLIVPLASSGKITLHQAYPFTLGANIGTTITALLAAMSVTGDYRLPALQIALVHFFYNLLGVLLILSIPFLRELPIWCAVQLGRLAALSRVWPLVYLLSVFFLLPGIALYVQQQLNVQSAAEEEHGKGPGKQLPAGIYDD